MNYVLIPKFCELSGYTEKAVRRKMESGVWAEGKHWKKAPDGRILINIPAIEHWIETHAA